MDMDSSTDSNSNTIIDPEVASELVTVLARKLKVARTQLRESQAERRNATTPYASDPSDNLAQQREQTLIAENESLKENNVVLQEMIRKLKCELGQSSIKSEETNPLQFSEPMSDGREEISRLLAENEDLTREKDKALRTREKLTILREKYKRTKARAHEYCENLNELRGTLSNCTQALESKKSAVSEIDFREFLKDFPCEPVRGQLELSSIEAYKLHKDVLNKSNGPYLISSNEVVWSPSGIAVGLVVKPMFRYNPKVPGGTWIKYEDNFKVGKQMDVCLLSKSDGKSRYLGTYERTGEKDITVIAVKTLKYMDHAKLNYVSKRTIMYPDLLPPAQAQMIKNMYKEGVIKIQCFAIRCVAFDQSFADKIRDTCAPRGQRNLQHGTVILEPGSAKWNERKRKRDPKSTVHSTPKKRKS